MSDELMEIFTECITAIEEGRLTRDECLAKYEQYRAELEPLLLVTSEMSALPAAIPEPAFRQAASTRLMAKVQENEAVLPAAAAAVAAQTTIPLTERLLMGLQTLAQAWPFSSRSTWAVGMSVIAFTFLMTGLLFSSSLSSASTWYRNNLLPEEDRPATVEVLEGSVEVLAADGEWQAVSKFATVSAGQRLRTGDFSSAKLTYADGSSMDIGPNMEFTVANHDNSAGFPALGPSPTPTPTMVITPTPTMVITPTPTMVITPTPTLVITPTPTLVITPTPTMVITPTPTMVITPTPTMVITPTPTVGVTPTPTPGQERVTICHKPGTPAEQTKTIPLPALNGHLGHGDTLGPCTSASPTPPSDPSPTPSSDPSPTPVDPTPTVPGPTPTPPEPTATPGGDGTVTICHKPGSPAQKTMTIPASALQGHLNHGDTLGACE